MNDIINNKAMVMTSSRIVKLADDSYRSMPIGYNSMQMQYATMTYIDPIGIPHKFGTIDAVMGANELYDLGMMGGFLIRMNALYKFYHSNQILYQNNFGGLVYNLDKFVPLELLYSSDKALSYHDYANIADKAVKEYNYISNYPGDIVKDIQNTSNNELFECIIKEYYSIRHKLYEIINENWCNLK